MAIAKVSLVCRCCGESFVAKATKQNRAQADAWEAWARENIEICPDCYAKAKKEKALEEKKEKVRAWVGDHTLPALSGTPKQVAWAESIRLDKLFEFAEMIGSSKRVAGWFWSWLENEASAKFWIESRDLDVRSFVALIEKEAAK